MPEIVTTVSAATILSVFAANTDEKDSSRFYRSDSVHQVIGLGKMTLLMSCHIVLSSKYPVVCLATVADYSAYDLSTNDFGQIEHLSTA